jgi:ribonuclease E
MEASPDAAEQTPATLAPTLAPTGEPSGEPAGEAAEANREEAVASTDAEAAERTAEPTAADEDGRGRRRGRRGGRRRRRDDGELSPYAEPGAEQPDMTPVYAGPTPADPFGGRAFDIFDVMDQVERAQANVPPPRSAEPAPESGEVHLAEGEIVNSGALEPETVAAEVPRVAADAAAPASVAAEAIMNQVEINQTEIVNTGATEVAVEQVATAAEEPAMTVPPEPEPVAAEPPPPPEPLVKPILIGASDEPAVVKKRGWWRR